MNIFLSWSGEKSKKVANLFKDWLPQVIQAIKPWVSTQDIESGKGWHSQIQGSLNISSFGIFCLTKDNKDTPWILYEAGAISKGDPKNNVCTFLVDLKATDLINNPLSSFNHTFNNKDSIFKLIKEINGQLGELKLDDEVLKKAFEKNYPDFDTEMQKILKDSPTSKPTLTLQEQTINEILTTVRKVHYAIIDTKANVKSIKSAYTSPKRSNLLGLFYDNFRNMTSNPSQFQREVDSFTNDFVEKNGRFPTNEEIEKAFKKEEADEINDESKDGNKGDAL